MSSAPTRCRHLRWKAYYTGLPIDPLRPELVDDLCWCVRTQRCLGPDGAVADHRGCRPRRGCFEAEAGSSPTG